MKYGEQFEKESVPEWSLHNIDYNSLKHHIKVHTTKDQATAITIPGRPNTALTKFEDDFYDELCRQHDRVDLFVSSKADEIARRLQHLSGQMHRLILRCATSGGQRMSLKRRQRFAKYEHTLLQCNDDIKSLRRFVSAQVVAFRKILKKYRKWTGSSALGARFKEEVLSHPKSFTRRDFSQLQSQHDDLLHTLHAALPANPAGGMPLIEPESRSACRPGTLSANDITVPQEPQPALTYWNEYEYGSEAGDFDRNGDEYAIYINPDEDSSFPGMKALGGFFAKPIHKLSAWIAFHPGGPDTPTPDPERSRLLTTHPDPTPYGTTDRSPPELSYFSSPPGGANTNSTATAAGTDTDADLEDDDGSSPYPSHRHSRRNSGSVRGYTSSSDDQQFFPAGFNTRHTTAEGGYAPHELAHQQVARYRERVLLLATWGCLGVAFVLTGIAAVLVAAGRQKMRLEVDAGVTVGIMTSLGLACAALCMMGSRWEKAGWLGQVAVCAAFAVVCVVDGGLLVLVMGNVGI